jgi:hypothetical protein
MDITPLISSDRKVIQSYGCGYFRVAWEATRLSVMLYILPFFFITEVSLLLRPEVRAWYAAR